MNKQLLIGAGAIILLVLVAVSFLTKDSETPTTKEPTKISVVLDWFPWSAHAGLHVAKEKGYFAEEGLDVELRVPSDPSTILQTVASGRDDFGLSYQPDLILGRAQGVPVVSVAALVQHPMTSIMTLQSSGFSRPRDLVGRKLGHAGFPFNTPVVDTMLKHDGVAGGLDDIEFVTVGFDVVPALIGKQVDAILGYWVLESILLEKQGFPVNIMRAEQNGVPDYYEFVFVTNEEKIANDPDIVQRFVKAVKRGYEEAAADPQAAIQLMKQVNPELDLSVESKGVDLLAPLWKADNGVFGWQEESRWLEFAQWMKDNGLLSQDVDARKAFTNRFVENAR